MDRTLIESRQLDLLFDQMLARRLNPTAELDPENSTAATSDQTTINRERQAMTQSGQMRMTVDGSSYVVAKLYDPFEFCHSVQCDWKGIR
jgi:hypothetical protein